MEIVIDNLPQNDANTCVALLKSLLATDIRVEREWVELWQHGDSWSEEILYQVIFSLPNLDDHAMNILTDVFSGSGFSFSAPELGMRWTIV